MPAADLKDHVSIITGSGTGIGKATAVRFADLGSRLALVGRSEANLKETKEACLKVNAELKDEDILCIGADVGNDEDVEAIVTKTVAHFGRLDVVVNNAGHSLADGAETFNTDHFDSLIRVHVRGIGLLVKFAIPHLAKTKGSVVNVASVGGLRVVPSFVSYSTAKAALVHMSKCTSIELATQGIRVNVVCPGFVFTELGTRMGVDKSAIEAYAEGCKARYPLRRVCQPEEVASVISFLASKDASYLTGVVIPVDGGLTTMFP
jgi:NAD(P)-dependent dehydrogenase (short-subunit alcohol dehydrogenase family)